MYITTYVYDHISKLFSTQIVLNEFLKSQMTAFSIQFIFIFSNIT